MRTLCRGLVVAGMTLTGSLMTQGVQAAEASAMTIDAIETCIASNVITHGGLRELEIKTAGGGIQRQMSVRLHWKPDEQGQARINLGIIEPEDLAGSSYLLRRVATGDEVYLYLPAVNKVKQFSGSAVNQSLWGTDFSYADLKHLQGVMIDGATTRLSDRTLAGRKNFVLAITPQSDGGYSKVVSYIDQASCTLSRAEFYTHDEEPAKVLKADMSTLVKTDVYTRPLWLVLSYSMIDPMRGTISTLNMTGVHIMENISEKAFLPDSFYKPFKVLN
jgi:hypothetical protein